MRRETLVATMTALPYNVREYYVEEAIRRNESLSVIIRELLIAYFEMKHVSEKMEDSG